MVSTILTLVILPTVYSLMDDLASYMKRTVADRERRVKQLAVVLLSGGLDSCVTAAVARQNFDLALFHLDYGHRTNARERRAFLEIADHYRVPVTPSPGRRNGRAPSGRRFSADRPKRTRSRRRRGRGTE